MRRSIVTKDDEPIDIKGIYQACKKIVNDSNYPCLEREKVKVQMDNLKQKYPELV
jgi:hypothetical protein